MSSFFKTLEQDILQGGQVASQVLPNQSGQVQRITGYAELGAFVGDIFSRLFTQLFHHVAAANQPPAPAPAPAVATPGGTPLTMPSGTGANMITGQTL